MVNVALRLTDKPKMQNKLIGRQELIVTMWDLVLCLHLINAHICTHISVYVYVLELVEIFRQSSAALLLLCCQDFGVSYVILAGKCTSI